MFVSNTHLARVADLGKLGFNHEKRGNKKNILRICTDFRSLYSKHLTKYLV